MQNNQHIQFFRTNTKNKKKMNPSLFAMMGISIDTPPKDMKVFVDTYRQHTRKLTWLYPRITQLLEEYKQDSKPLSTREKELLDLFQGSLERYKITITKMDLINLAGSAWITDQVMDMHMMDLASKYDGVTYCSVFYYPELVKHVNEKTITALTKGEWGTYDFSKPLILIPLNYNNIHWALGVIRPEQALIQVFDSFLITETIRQNKAQSFFTTIQSFFKGRRMYKGVNWSLDIGSHGPLQNNQNDCGVFVIKIAEALMKGRDIQDANIIPMLMPTYRKRIASNLVSFENK